MSNLNSIKQRRVNTTMYLGTLLLCLQSNTSLLHPLCIRFDWLFHKTCITCPSIHGHRDKGLAVLDRPLLRSFTSHVILFKWPILHLCFLNWKSKLTFQQLCTILSMRTMEVEPMYHQQCPSMPTHQFNISSPSEKVLRTDDDRALQV